MDEQALHDVSPRSGRKGDDSSLYLIRDKEMEIAGRVLATRKQAEEIIGDARKKAATIVGDAQTQGQELVKAKEAELFAETDRQIEELKAAAAKEREQLKKSISGRSAAAVEHLMDLIRP